MVEDLRLDSLEGVGPVTTRKLSDAGVHNVMDLIVRGPVDIADITGMEKDTAEKIVNKARQHLVEGGLIAKDFVSASEIYKNRNCIRRSGWIDVCCGNSVPCRRGADGCSEWWCSEGRYDRRLEPHDHEKPGHKFLYGL